MPPADGSRPMRGRRKRSRALRSQVDIVHRCDLSDAPALDMTEAGRDLQDFVRLFGHAHAEALQAAARIGDEIMRRGDELGQIRAVLIADLLLVDGDALGEIRALQDRADREGRRRLCPLHGAAASPTPGPRLHRADGDCTERSGLANRCSMSLARYGAFGPKTWRLEWIASSPRACLDSEATASGARNAS